MPRSLYIDIKTYTDDWENLIEYERHRWLDKIVETLDTQVHFQMD